MREDRHQTHEISGFLPSLRRFARALVGRDAADPVECADHLVGEALERASRSERVLWSGNPRIWLYATLTSLNRTRLRASAEALPASPTAVPAASQPLPASK